jgi:hypothetical protein
MSNTLTNLIPDAYKALDVVSRELVGFIPAVTKDADVDRVAIGQNIRSFKTRANTAGRDITAAMAFPAAAYQTVDNEAITISKSRAFPFSWSGEQRYAVDQGPGSLTIAQDQIAQAIRAAVNEIETDLATAAALGGSRAVTPVSSTLFSTNLGDPAQLRKVLDDNGAPLSDRHLIINTGAGAAMRTLAQLTKANEAGSTDPMRRGVLMDIHGFAIRESAQIVNPAVGTSTTAVVATGGVALGATSITLKAAGTGTILAGDTITIQDDPNKYVVTVGAAAVSGAVIQIAAPGLRQAIVGEKTITITAAAPRNVGFTRPSIILASRLPELNPEGDLAIERQTITDPVSGLSFELAAYPGYRMITYEVSLAWGVKVIKPEHVALLIG